MARRIVIFEDSFFDRLDARLELERSDVGVPSRTDVLAIEVPPLMDVLARDDEGFTLPIPGSDVVRVLIQRGSVVESIVLWTELVDEEVRVFDIQLKLFFDD